MELIPAGHNPKRRSGRQPETTDVSGGAGEFSQLALWMSGTLAGMVTSMLIARAPFFRKLLRRISPASSAPLSKSDALARHVQRPSPEQSLPMLAEAVMGSTKSSIASVFGPPRGAVLSGAPGPNQSTFWHADTWYYPLRRNGRMTMAIAFDDDHARQVEFFQAPCARAA